MNAFDPDACLFRAELRPHRSSTLRGVHVFMWVLAVFWVPLSVLFIVIGAWPVFPFMGAEVLLLYALLRLNLRRGREVETIAVTARELCVERVSHWGKRDRWSFQPQWLQVLIENRRGRHADLLLRSHGRSLAIGRFLTVDEKVGVAERLKRVLADLRNPVPA
ncbi:MAG: DUF2244 domain-containing protein [Rhodospirillales bacterium CG15_BIG_FIL_POST_REV_8_21_14_020_66_15]|nr:MAG: DUF2244 domain-containing protein [Rhodospirillales bacterium CG15_BIG_FIL_POST_REV_8_21_14_020_66_15]